MRRLFLFILIAMTSFVSDGQEISVIAPDTDPRVQFGVQKIQEAYKVARPYISKRYASEVAYKHKVIVEIVTDAVRVLQLVQANSWQPVKSLSEQCYAFRINPGQAPSTPSHIYILAGEPVGAMYGALDV